MAENCVLGLLRKSAPGNITTRSFKIGPPKDYWDRRAAEWAVKQMAGELYRDFVVAQGWDLHAERPQEED